jgi:hypothetical protein
LSDSEEKKGWSEKIVSKLREKLSPTTTTTTTTTTSSKLPSKMGLYEKCHMLLGL